MTTSAIAYEKHASRFLQNRDLSSIGGNVIRQWAVGLANATDILELACGGGYPITRELLGAGHKVWAIDSSPTLLAEFSARFPQIACRCEQVQESSFFERKFSAVVAVGVVFLLPEAEQVALLRRVAGVLKNSGNFIFTAPVETGSWRDVSTGLECMSLGYERYRSELLSLGFENIESFVDSGKNHYYACEHTAV